MSTSPPSGANSSNTPTEDPIYHAARGRNEPRAAERPFVAPPPTTTDHTQQYLIVIGMILVVALPVGLTLNTPQFPTSLQPPPPSTPIPAPAPVVAPVSNFDSPFGYTLSLLIFLVPILTIAWWFFRYPTFHTERKAFWYTVLTLAPMGLILDTFLGPSFFKFVNSGATLRIFGPGLIWGEGFKLVIPIEEYAFYFLGFLAVLLIYIWSNLYWLRAYSPVDRTPLAKNVAKIVIPHWPFFTIGVVVIVLSFLYKRFGPHPYQEGFPGYFVFLALLGLLPTIAFFRTAQPLINWRAFSFTFFVVVLISLIWEATVAIPYQWWGYHFDQMLGIMIFPWAQLPIEAVIVWVVVTWATVIFYEVMRIFLYMNKSYTEAFMGWFLTPQPPTSTTPPPAS